MTTYFSSEPLSQQFVQFKELSRAGNVFSLNRDYIYLVEPSRDGHHKPGARVHYKLGDRWSSYIVESTYSEVMVLLNG